MAKQSSEKRKAFYLANRERLLEEKRRAYQGNREAHLERNRERRRADPEAARAADRQSYLRRREKILEQKREYGEKNKSAIATKNRRYWRQNKDRLLAAAREYNEQHADRLSEQRKKKYAANRTVILAKNKDWREANREWRRRYNTKYWTEVRREAEATRYANDPNFKLVKVLRQRTVAALRGKRKSAPTLDLLGCDVDTARAHIEAQFKPGMTWRNHAQNGWHVDHVRPFASFPDLTDPEQQRQVCHYTNLQPLWWWENLSKKDKWAGDPVGCRGRGRKAA